MRVHVHIWKYITQEWSLLRLQNVGPVVHLQSFSQAAVTPMNQTSWVSEALQDQVPSPGTLLATFSKEVSA